MTNGTSQGMFIVVAIVIFGIFVGLTYTLFGSEGLSNDLKSIFENGTEQSTNLFKEKSYYAVENAIPSPAEDFEFKEGTIINYLGSETDVVIPYEIEGIKVTILGKDSFSKKGLKSVLIPNTVTTLEDSSNFMRGTFSDNLISEIIIPDSVETIGSWAFYNNKLTKLHLPDSVKTLGQASFRHNSISDLKLSKNIKTIAWASFYENKIKNLVIPNGVVNLDKGAFMLNGMETVVIPSSVNTIKDSVFSLNSFTEFTVPRTVNTLEYEFIGRNPQLKKLNIPKELKSTIENNRNIIINDINYYGGSGSTIVINNYFDETGSLFYY